nr:4842_t:CDS:2 [Entrophospora candida]
MDHILSVVPSDDSEEGVKLVTVEAGIELSKLNKELSENHDLALSNLGSISDLTVGGVISTGTHGTGIEFGCMHTQVVSLTLLTSKNQLISCSESENQEIFKAALCSLGSLGVILRVTLRCEQAFRLDSIQLPEKLNNVLDNLDQLIHSAQHFRFWWFPHTDDCVTWKANRVNKVTPKKKSSNFIKDNLISYHLYQLSLCISKFIPNLIPIITKGMFKLNHSKKIERVDDSYEIFNFDCLFPQYVNEWAVPIEFAADAIRKLDEWINNRQIKVHFPVEVRFVNEDDVWLSPAYKRKVCFIGIIMYRPYYLSVPYEEYWNAYENIMRSFDGRPHWAKAHSMTPKELYKTYPKLTLFIELQKRLDPNSMFINDYIKRHLLLPSEGEYDDDNES